LNEGAFNRKGAPVDRATDDSGPGIPRHALAVRLTHWINAICFVFLLWSGAGILIAFPQFHWGQVGYVGMAPLFALPITLDTHATAWARPLHFAFAWVLLLNGLVYIAHGVASGHFRRHLLPGRAELRPRRFIAEILRHLDLRQRHGDGDGYNLVQRIAYLLVIFVLVPLMLLSGLALSPAVVADQPWLTDMLFGRQSARLLHFLAASGLVLFIVVHLGLVLLSGPVRMIGAMITGHVRQADRK
jgi:Ni/Fe-hydrogenase b-type cytochrome subunit